MPGEPRAQGSALISPDQEAGIRDSVRNDRSAHADFGLAVGSVVPRGQRLAILPDDAVSIAPRFRGYKFVIVEDEIVIVDPRTYRVAAVIPEAGGPGLEPGGPDVEPGGPSLEPRGPGVEPGGRIPETGNPAPGPSGPGGCARC
ncbi:MAG TPA: DUF1236 domain-containing protein [Roseiarcus sp.]|nr:DUF1236 domain-containing protein [Roseiarcus sp.]